MAVFHGSEKHREMSRKGLIVFSLQKQTKKARFFVLRTGEKSVNESIWFRDKG